VHVIPQPPTLHPWPGVYVPPDDDSEREEVSCAEGVGGGGVDMATSCTVQHIFFLGVFVTREHVRHNKSGITHRGKTRISH
jgi:hypothetical protein